MKRTPRTDKSERFALRFPGGLFWARVEIPLWKSRTFSRSGGVVSPISTEGLECLFFGEVDLRNGFDRAYGVMGWAAFVASLLVCGCSSRKPPIAWEPAPRVTWTDIATESMPAVQNEYRILRPEPTQGLFPAAMAVTRVSREAWRGEIDDTNPRPTIALHPRNETLQFNSAFDDLMAVSEVFPIAQRTLGGGEAVPAQILAAYRALHARIGLIYAVNELSSAKTEVIAVLYEIRDGRPLACYHTQETSRVDSDEKERARAGTDPWQTDSRALARRKFDCMVHASLRELIQRDEPAPLEDKSGWTPILPPRPPAWPPVEGAGR